MVSTVKGFHCTCFMCWSIVHLICHAPFRVWFEGSEGDLIWKRRYLGGGFIFLQDMVERAVVEQIVGHRVPTPGAYVHQMPYHCYDNDLLVFIVM